jgi:UDP-N-acetylmuramoyl-L-alanyl-D-glutamate--2,6-diaminopimelate ligase
MKLSRLTENLRCDIYGNANCEVDELSISSKEKMNKALFFCLKGTSADGHEHYEESIANGAAALVCEKYIKNANVPQILVKSARNALALISSSFYGNPSKKLKIITITGTNGKTTTSFLIKSILERAGKKVGLIGTNGAYISNNKLGTALKLTTPDPIELHHIFRQMADKLCEYVVMEASAHSIFYNKLDGIRAEAAVFTNLSQDHLDFFKTIEEYKRVKKSYFVPELCKHAVINIDDELGREIAASCKTPVVTYGYNNPADVFAVKYTPSFEGLSYVLNANDDISEINLHLTGKFNMYNSLAAAACAKLLGIKTLDITQGINDLKKVDGRFNVYKHKSKLVIIDYAHTPDGLANVLSVCRELCRGKLICVFGCGGNRDRSKRKIMGEAASKYADYIVLTNDNPRNEVPEEIIKDIEEGIGGENYTVCVDRAEAIKLAVRLSKPHDAVIIAGKGGEQYMEIGNVRIKYNDEEALRAAFNELKN